MSALIALLSIPENECPGEEHLISEKNATILMYSFKGENQSEEFFVNRNFQYIQGTIIIGGIIQTVIGVTGIIGFLLKYRVVFQKKNHEKWQKRAKSKNIPEPSLYRFLPQNCLKILKFNPKWPEMPFSA